MSENDHWDCPTCGRPTPPEIDIECHCGMMASHHVSVWELCKRLREIHQRNSALIVENNEQARLLGMSGERECDLRGQLERERALADRLATALAYIDFRLAFIKDTANISFENISSMRSMVFSNLEAWKGKRDEP